MALNYPPVPLTYINVDQKARTERGGTISSGIEQCHFQFVGPQCCCWRYGRLFYHECLDVSSLVS